MLCESRRFRRDARGMDYVGASIYVSGDGHLVEIAFEYSFWDCDDCTECKCRWCNTFEQRVPAYAEGADGASSSEEGEDADDDDED